MKPKNESDGVKASLDHKLQSHIGSKLKQYYNEIVSESVPDRFKMLLDQLEKTESKQQDKTESKQ
jgi:hypothetical protein